MFMQLSTILHSEAISLSWPKISAETLASVAMLAFLVILIVIETYHPKQQWRPKRLRRSYLTNFSFFIFNNGVLSLLSVTSLLVLAQNFAHWGLLSGLDNPWLKGAISFLLLDLLFYAWHKASHTFEWLWKFHRIHHSDTCVNASTAFRLHTVELFVATVLKAVFILATGIEATMVFAYEWIMILFVMLHHGNISLAGEKWLSLVFVVPGIHRLHHSTVRAQHDSNYGAVFSFWDRLFGTLLDAEPDAVGLKGDVPETFWQLLYFGFTPIAAPVTPAQAAAIDINTMIAEAAYYKAEKRGFKPGDELLDWFEAEREIINMVYAKQSKRKVQPNLCRVGMGQMELTLNG